jgi:hypothetical protein
VLNLLRKVLLDRLHPNEFGYKKMAWTWYRALEPLLNTGGRAWPGAAPRRPRPQIPPRGHLTISNSGPVIGEEHAGRLFEVDVHLPTLAAPRSSAAWNLLRA